MQRIHFSLGRRSHACLAVLGLLVGFSCTVHADEADIATPPMSESRQASQERIRFLEQQLDEQSAADRRIASLLRSAQNPFALIPYEQNYMMYSFSDGVNSNTYEGLGDKLDDHEVKFQFSIMFPIWGGMLGKNTALMASYTQVSLWQALNQDISAPFRETNYEPQIFMGWLTNASVLGMKLRWIEAGFNHQSNGRGDKLSRSWNRLFANFMFEKGDFSLNVRPYFRLKEPLATDDNPDIEDYVGHHKLDLAYRDELHVWTIRSRYNFETGNGSAELGWSYQLTPHVRVYSQLFHGYGETLIDYDFEQTRFGIGLMLNDLL